MFFVVVDDARLQLPPRPAPRRTRTMNIDEAMETERSTQEHGDTFRNDDYDTPLVGYINKKKQKTKKN